MQVLLQTLLDGGLGAAAAWVVAFVLMRAVMTHPMFGLQSGTFGALVPVAGAVAGIYYDASKFIM